MVYITWGGGSLVKLNDLDYLVAMLLYKLIVFETLHICKLVVHLFFSFIVDSVCNSSISVPK
jgi:hypothetical protein